MIDTRFRASPQLTWVRRRRVLGPGRGLNAGWSWWKPRAAFFAQPAPGVSSVKMRCRLATLLMLALLSSAPYTQAEPAGTEFNCFAVLADHYEGTEIDSAKTHPQSKGHPSGICHDGTQYGFVAQLRADMPAAIGAVLWIDPYHPCSKVYVPWYAGMTRVPDGFSRFDSVQAAQDRHLTEVRDFRVRRPDHRYWQYVDSSNAINSDYAVRIERYATRKAALQREILERQAGFEAQARQLEDKARLGELLNHSTKHWIDREQL
jgi:hypothetical protein